MCAQGLFDAALEYLGERAPRLMIEAPGFMQRYVINQAHNELVDAVLALRDAKASARERHTDIPPFRSHGHRLLRLLQAPSVMYTRPNACAFALLAASPVSVARTAER